uniref:MYND-type domain-containing protein n=1 Tax=Hyaloperonospora arabidopsidis (strain Emoy2) TaxID=559515 RepID=M4BP63_HYAAE
MSLYHEVLDPLKGRCAVASKALPAGSRVLQTFATSAVSSPSSCDSCFVSQVSLSRCTGCRIARYCSRRCQQLDWPQHRWECQAWRSIPAAHASPTLLLVTRLAFKLFRSSKITEEARNAVLTLCHHLHDHSEKKRQVFDDMTQLVLLLLSRYKASAKQQIPSFDELEIDLKMEILKLFGRVNCNAFSIANGVTNEALGIGLFPEGALFNHDCDPNSIVSFKGREMLVHVVKDVAAGQEITFSYVELLQSTQARRSELKESYFFDCECARCQAALKEEAGKVKDDWYLDGLVCTHKEGGVCGGVVVVEKSTGYTVGCAVCKLCGCERDGEEIDRYEKLLKSFEALDVDSEQRKWEAYQQRWKIMTQQLQLHPRNGRVAAMAREIGNFLCGATSSDLRRLALPFFVAELHAVEWLLPKTKLPSRGLLHFQMGKLMFEELESSPGTLSRVDQVDRLGSAANHLHESLST